MYELIFRVHLLGVSGVGISTLSNKFLSSMPIPYDKWSSLYLTEVVEFFSKLISINDKTYKLYLWIYNRDERLRSFLPEFLNLHLKPGNGILLIYDITNTKTLDSLMDYIQLIKENELDVPIMLVGNKIDLEEKRDVSKEHSIQFAERYNLSKFIEISAKTGENIEDMFEALTRIMMEEFNPKIWKVVKKYIWYDKNGYLHFDGDQITDEDYDIIYNAYHPIRCTYCWMIGHNFLRWY